MRYAIPIRFTGRITYIVEAENEESARNIAAELAYDANCGDLTDVDWEAKPAVDRWDS